MKPEAVLKRLKKIDEATFQGLVEIYDNQIFHEENCPDCKASGEVVCPHRPARAQDFSLEDKYTPALIQWIIEQKEDLDSFFEKKRAYGETSVGGE